MISGYSLASATSLPLSRLDPRQVDELGQSAGEGGRVELELVEVLQREAEPREGAREVLVVAELEIFELAVLLCGRGARRRGQILEVGPPAPPPAPERSGRGKAEAGVQLAVQT